MSIKFIFKSVVCGYYADSMYRPMTSSRDAASVSASVAFRSVRGYPARARTICANELNSWEYSCFIVLYWIESSGPKPFCCARAVSTCRSDQQKNGKHCTERAVSERSPRVWPSRSSRSAASHAAAAAPPDSWCPVRPEHIRHSNKESAFGENIYGTVRCVMYSILM